MHKQTADPQVRMRIGLAAEGRGPIFASDGGRGDASNSLAPFRWHARGIVTTQLARAAWKMSETTDV